MDSLIEEVPEAKIFCEEVGAHVADFKLFQEENFANLTSVVLSTTGIDSQGHTFTKAQLETFADRVNTRRHWGGMHHDPRIHPINRGLAAKVFYSPSRDLYFLAVVLGFYHLDRLPTFSDVGIDITSLSERDTIDLPRGSQGPYSMLALNPHEVDISKFQSLISSAEDIVDSHVQVRFRKAAELPTIVTVLASLWLLSNNPFGKKFLERYGEVAADQSLRFLAWLKDKVVAAVASLTGPRVMFEIESQYFGCDLQFVVASSDAEVLAAAIAALPAAASSAASLVRALAALEPVRLVYEYQHDRGRWLPLHGTTARRGVIADRTFLISAQELARMGLSIGGISPTAEIGERGREDDRA